MFEYLAVIAIISLGMTIWALKQEKKYKLEAMIEDGYKPKAKDRDKDGIVQEGTKWERKVSKKSGKK